MEQARGRIAMNGEELKKLRVIQDLLSKRLSQGEASEALGLSIRQIRRLKKRVKNEGEFALVHRLAGRKGNRALKNEVRDKILTLWNEKYSAAGLNFSHFTEKLQEIEHVSVKRETVRKLLRGLGLSARKVKKSRKHRKKRERKPRFGELIQQDTSPHDWLGTGIIYHMIAAIDDATSQILSAQLFTSDGTLQNMAVMKSIFSKHGLPMAVYTDKAAWFHVTPKKQRLPFNKTQEVKTRPLTQIGRALEQLGVELIAAHSPQAKGRIERLNGTLQDRMIAELKLAGITRLSEANEFIEKIFIPDHNGRFALHDLETESAFVRLAQPQVLNEILCIEFTGTVQNDNTVSKPKRYTLQCLATARRAHWAKAKVRIRITTEGAVLLHHAHTQEAIPFKILELMLPKELKHQDPLLADGKDISIWEIPKKSGHS